MNIERNNPTSRSGIGFDFDNNISKHKAIRKVKSLKVRSLPHYETNQCRGVAIQAFMFYDNPFYVSCFFVATLPRIYHSRKNP